MTFPFMEDPVPPGHGESQRVLDAIASTPEYSVIVVLGDGIPQVEKRFGDLGKALEYREKVRGELKEQGYNFFFVGVMDEDNVEAGWLEDDEAS